MVLTKEKKIDLKNIKIPDEIYQILDDKPIQIPDSSFSDPLLKFPSTPSNGRYFDLFNRLMSYKINNERSRS